MKKKKLKNNLTGYAFITPSLVLLTVFIIVPILMSFYLSMTKYNGFQAPQWIGVQNFANAFTDAGVQASLKNTFIFVIISVPLQLGLALVIAALLAAKFRNAFGAFVRSAMFVPVLCSATLIGAIFSFLFAPNAEAFFNSILVALGFEKINWLGNPKTALGTIMFVNTWKSVGYYLVIFYAGIMDISNDLYEASAIDGATKIQQFFRITVPNLRNILVMMVIVCTIWSFQIFDLAYVMTEGGPGYSTTSLVYQIYNQVFRGQNFGYGSAIAVILFLFILIINLIQRLVLREEK